MKNKIQHFLFIVILAIIATPTFAQANECLELFSEPINVAKAIDEVIAEPKVYPRKLTIWRYGGHEDFNQASHTVWQFYGDHYSVVTLGEVNNDRYELVGTSIARSYQGAPWKYENPAKTELESGSEGNTFLERNQHFPLQVMQDTSYINKEIADGQGNIAERLSPNQITFFETTIEMRESELVEKFGELPVSARRDSLDEAWTRYQSYFDHSLISFDPFSDEKTEEREPEKPDLSYDLKIGTSWLVSGQDAAGNNFDLPLQAAPLVTPVNREADLYAWEVGRAAQSEPQGFTETLKASFYFALRELHLLGGEMDDAFIFAHSLKPIHTRMYRSTFGMSVYSAYQADPHEVVLRAPLQVLVDKFPPTEFSGNIQRIHEVSKKENGEYELTPLESFQLDFRARQNRTVYLETPNGSVVTLRDFSELSPFRALQPLGTKLLGKDDLTNELYYEASRARTVSLPIDTIEKQYQRVQWMRLPQTSLRQFLDRRRAIELQFEIAQGDSAPQVIEQAVVYLHDQLKAERFEDPVKLLEQLDVEISVTLMPRQYAGLDWGTQLDSWQIQKYETMSSLGFMRNVVEPGFTIGSYSFKLSKIMEHVLAKEREPIELVKGQIHLRNHLYSPELYSGDD